MWSGWWRGCSRLRRNCPPPSPKFTVLAQTLAPAARAGDFAQALMDLGATLCTPSKPACALCPWMADCAARRRGDPQMFPRKAPKREGRLRRGASFVLLRADGSVLLRTRPPEGLLGGMTEVPSTAWSYDFDEAGAIEHAPRLARARPKWRRLPGVVYHGFTHFPLEQTVYVANVPARSAAPEGTRWTPIADLPGEALPNVMRKVLAHALGDDVKRK